MFAVFKKFESVGINDVRFEDVVTRESFHFVVAWLTVFNVIAIQLFQWVLTTSWVGDDAVFSICCGNVEVCVVDLLLDDRLELLFGHSLRVHHNIC